MSIANFAVRTGLVGPLVAGLVIGCQTTTDPYTGEKKTTTTALRALIGAGAGAAIGMISGHDAKQRRQRALGRAGGDSTQGAHGISRAARGGRRRRRGAVETTGRVGVDYIVKNGIRDVGDDDEIGWDVTGTE